MHGHLQDLAHQIEQGHLQSTPETVVMHGLCRTGAFHAFHRLVRHSCERVVQDGLSPAYMAGVRGDLAQLQYGPVVDLAGGDLLLAIRERHIHYDSLDIDDFHNSRSLPAYGCRGHTATTAVQGRTAIYRVVW